MITALDRFDWEGELQVIVKEHVDAIPDLQREQMLRGIDNEGNYIRPFYSESPYFKTPEAARNYAAWKEKISPKTDRPADVPNLYINGYYQRGIGADISGSAYRITSGSKIAGEVEGLHQKVIGLNIQSRLDFIDNITRPVISKVVFQKLGLTVLSR